MTLTVVGIHDFYENNLLMWLQEAYKIAQYKKKQKTADWARFARPALFAPPPQEKPEMTPLYSERTNPS